MFYYYYDNVGSDDTTAQDSLSQDMESLLTRKLWPDFVVEVEGKQFPCHRAVLFSRSSHFRAIVCILF